MRTLASCFNRYTIKTGGLILLMLMIGLHGWSQFKVTILLKTLPVSHNGEPVFISGNFNDWNPEDGDFKITTDGKDYKLVLENVGGGNYQFKFTRGNWDKVESTVAGADIENRFVEISSDTALEFSIAGWKDDFVSTIKKHTASANVQVLDTAFDIPQLHRKRRIWVYLPPGYKVSKRKYPVMYMHDGQNLFDAATAPFGEWGVDESLDSLAAEGKPSCIVVGIDNGGETRMNEYNPYVFIWKDSTSSKTFMPEGEAYTEFIVKTLKPFIDHHLRTLPSKENTIIAGSSMGGLISCYAVLKYPDIFGKAGIFSPAFWTADGFDKMADSANSRLNAKLFFYTGEKEGDKYVEEMNRIEEKIGRHSAAMIYSVIDKDGEHNEAAWHKWFIEFYAWIMADGYNTVLKTP